MKSLRTVFLPILAATFWISISEFVRNEFVLKSVCRFAAFFAIPLSALEASRLISIVR